MNARATLLAAACLAVLGSCGGEQYSDLKQFVKDADSLPRGRIPPLPEVKPYEPFPYNAYELSDPFKARKLEPPKTNAGGGIQPDLARRKEPLEAYPLDNLRMVGTLNQNKVTYALIKSPDSNLFRVKPGNYIGQNFGLVAEISESNIKLKEIVQDSGGDWTERTSTLTLIEEATK
jgi:type IV pilus assembly protein PilP